MKVKLFLAAIATASIAAHPICAQNATGTAPALPQDCRCEESFEWLRSTFETNDAGFGYIVERKGRAAYNLHNSMTLEKVRAAQNGSECRAAMSEWLGFFRRGHIGIELLIPDPAPTVQNAAQTTSKPEMWTGDIAAFKKEIATLETPGLEGVWEHVGGYYSVGIKAEGDGYTCFITKSRLPFFKPGQISARISRSGEKWQTTYYDYNNGTISEVADGKPEMVANALMTLGGEKLFRVSPAIPADSQIGRYVKSISTRTPYLEQLNPTTLYMRIGTFNHTYKPAIDKMLADNFDKITSTENLIIDLRGNGGGSGTSYRELLPLICTDPVRTSTVSFLSTPLNIEKTAEILDIAEMDEETRGRFAALVENMKARPGEFVSLYDEDVNIKTYDTVYEYPRSVGIIMDGASASSTEQFLLAVKQSRKVKLFGTTTSGALDASNVRTTDSPDGRFQLAYTTSLSSRIPGMAIDDIGLQPDYYLDPTIPDYRWVEFVNDTLNR